MKEISLKTLKDEFEFLQNNVGKILAKKLNHGNEVGYVQVYTDGDYEVMSIKFIPKKWFKKSKFTKIELFGLINGFTDTGELYFEIIWKETFTMTKLCCDYYIQRPEHVNN